MVITTTEVAMAMMMLTIMIVASMAIDGGLAMEVQ